MKERLPSCLRIHFPRRMLRRLQHIVGRHRKTQPIKKRPLLLLDRLTSSTLS